jgi:hypothetical protein
MPERGDHDHSFNPHSFPSFSLTPKPAVPQMISNVSGMLIGMAATLVTALYQSWAGSKQKELKASSMQLLQAYTPHATLLLGILVPLCEDVGWTPATRTKDTILGYPYNWWVTGVFPSSHLPSC